MNKLDEQISDIFARACYKNEYFGNDGWYELHTPTIRQEINKLFQELIDEVIREYSPPRELTSFGQCLECSGESICKHTISCNMQLEQRQRAKQLLEKL